MDTTERRLSLIMRGESASFLPEDLRTLLERFEVFSLSYRVPRGDREPEPVGPETFAEAARSVLRTPAQFLSSLADREAERLSCVYYKPPAWHPETKPSWCLTMGLRPERWSQRREQLRQVVRFALSKGFANAVLHNATDAALQNNRALDPELGWVSDESAPGHSHAFQYFQMAPGAVTWWGPLSRTWVSPERLEAFARGLRNQDIGDGVREIVLYDELDDLEACRREEYRARQWALRRHLGMCEISHGRALGSPPEPPSDPHVEVAGEGRLRYFLDAAGQSVPRSEAVDVFDYQYREDPA